MTTTVEIKGLLEERLELLVRAGMYASKSEAVRDGIRHLLKELDIKDIAFKLYRDGKISTGLALELVEIDLVTFLAQCQQRGIRPRTGIETEDELEADVKGLING
ncbi:MAG: UPF0175 family protein [Candidatus Hodarchaeales archaeon]|jgi:Arc/MetJ-type ribon-helix-helix transcriptional regulator